MTNQAITSHRMKAAALKAKRNINFVMNKVCRESAQKSKKCMKLCGTKSPFSHILSGSFSCPLPSYFIMLQLEILQNGHSKVKISQFTRLGL